MPPPAPVIVLNGASSAGKTSLAKAMQEIWPAPLHHIQLDAFRAMEPPGFWDGWEALAKETSDRMMDALCHAHYTAVRVHATHGQAVVLDTVLSHPRARQLLFEDLKGLPVRMVAVHCDLAELVRRETGRGDRALGLAATQAILIHQHMLYDFEVDTTQGAHQTLAIEISRWLANAPAPQAFDQLREQWRPSAD